MSVVAIPDTVEICGEVGVTPGPEAMRENRRLRAAVILAGFLAERSQSPMSYSQMVSKAVALGEALDREVR